MQSATYPPIVPANATPLFGRLSEVDIRGDNRHPSPCSIYHLRGFFGKLLEVDNSTFLRIHGHDTLRIDNSHSI